MKGIQYIIDDKADKTAVVIDLKQWGNLWEEFSNNFPAKNLREKEQCL